MAIALSLVMNPSLLLTDEPTGNLDTQTGIEIMSAFQTLNGRGITIVMVDHELDIFQYAKQNVVMRDRFQAKTEMEKLQREQQSDVLRIVLNTLKRNKLRTMLTTLGIVIGARAELEAQIKKMEQNIIMVFPISAAAASAPKLAPNTCRSKVGTWNLGPCFLSSKLPWPPKSLY